MDRTRLVTGPERRGSGLKRALGPLAAGAVALAKWSFVLVKFSTIFIAVGAYVAYTRGHPWQTVRVAIAGPILGGAAAFVFYLVAKSQHSDLLYALAYFGFFLNLFNLLPFGFFDGGAVWRSARFLRLGGGGVLAVAAYAMYFATIAMLVLGMIASHVSTQGRL